LDTHKLKELYTSYGFNEQPINKKGVIVFTLRSGHFHNADIIALSDEADIEGTFQELRKLDFACTVRKYSKIEEVEDALFRGFFSAKETKESLKKEYEKHIKSIEESLGIKGAYKYVEVGYSVNGEKGEERLLDVITSAFNTNRPTLILIEAAAGFGKTCTAFEVLNELLKSCSSKIPLFSELSRNRKAKIFRYVFLDEIDRSFPTLKSTLVQQKIKQGKVPVILDGFDELILQSNSSDDDGYDSAEPMLATIGELLEDNSKVLLTTRRTAIFDGDSFHEWVLEHQDNFDVLRIRLNEPTIEDWLTSNKINALERLNFPIKKLNNPVLLAYLRGVQDEDFVGTLNSNDIVDRYFSTLLEREKERQNLNLTTDEQLGIMRTIAADMISLNYTSESKDYLELLIADKFTHLLEKTRSFYTSAERPSLEELITKLTTHALLDRFGNKDSIGFINEFVLGNFVADVIVESQDPEWIGGPRFLEPAVIATIPRDDGRKEEFWNLIKFSVEFQESIDKITYSQSLCDEIKISLNNDTLSDRIFRNLSFGEHSRIERFVFLDCTFHDCSFLRANLISVTFVNCSFYNCNVLDKSFLETLDIDLINNTEDMPGFLEALGSTSTKDDHASDDENISNIELFILEKFWPRGKPRAFKHRSNSVFYRGSKFIPTEVHIAINNLKDRGILSTPDKTSFLELDFSKINLVKKILGRDS